MSGIATAVVGSAIIGAGASYLAGKEQAKGAQAAADTTAAGQKYATDIQYDMYKQTREDQLPWIQAGERALGRIEGYPDFDFSNIDFYLDPSYEFRKQEGINALDRSAASRGRVLSGAQDRAITRYGSKIAEESYGNAFNRALQQYQTNLGREQSLAGVGQSAQNLVSNAGQQTAGNMGTIAMNAANQIGQSQMAAGNAMANAYGGVGQSAGQGAGNYMLYNMISPTATTNAATTAWNSPAVNSIVGSF